MILTSSKSKDANVAKKKKLVDVVNLVIAHVIFVFFKVNHYHHFLSCFHIKSSEVI